MKFYSTSHSRPLLPSLARLALLGTALPLIGIRPAAAQDLHPDWSRVWNQNDQPTQQGVMTVPANVVVPVTLDNPLSSATARLGDIVTATPISRQDGDSEFPPGTRIGGVVSQVQSAYNSTPGVLDVDFQSVLLPDGTEVPMNGFIASLDSDAIITEHGHLIARDGNHVNAWKAIGIGGGAGFVLGRLLKTRTLVPTILGAAGAYLYARSNSHRGEDANISAGTAFGVRIESPISFPDPYGYAPVRLNYLETHRDYSPSEYGWNGSITASDRYRYDDYDVVTSRPLWVTVSPYDYYDLPLIPIFVPYRHTYRRDPRWDDRNSPWNRPDFHRGNGGNWNNHNPQWNNHNPQWNNRDPRRDDHNSTWNRPNTHTPGWNTPNTPHRGNDNPAWNPTWGISRPGTTNNRGNDRTRPNLPPIRTGPDFRPDSPQAPGRSTPSNRPTKTELTPISPDFGGRPNRNSDGGRTTPRVDNSNARPQRDDSTRAGERVAPPRTESRDRGRDDSRGNSNSSGKHPTRR